MAIEDYIEATFASLDGGRPNRETIRRVCTRMAVEDYVTAVVRVAISQKYGSKSAPSRKALVKYTEIFAGRCPPKWLEEEVKTSHVTPKVVSLSVKDRNINLQFDDGTSAVYELA